VARQLSFALMTAARCAAGAAASRIRTPRASCSRARVRRHDRCARSANARGWVRSSIYRHVRSKHELLVLELSGAPGGGVAALPARDDKSAPTRARVQRFLEVQHELLASDADLVVIALRATHLSRGAGRAPRARAAGPGDRTAHRDPPVRPARPRARRRRARRGPRAVPRRERRADQLGERAALRIRVPARGRRVGRSAVPRLSARD
jgi:hypothetical protein